MGELHLEVIKHRLLRDFNLNVKVHKPRVSYKETVKPRPRRWANASGRSAANALRRVQGPREAAGRTTSRRACSRSG